MAERRCPHGRTGPGVARCPACAMRITPDTYWTLIRELPRWRRTRRKAKR